MAKKVADQIVDTLVEAGIKRVYAVTGDSLNEINDSVRRNDKINWVHVRHEETGAYAATAESLLNGIACCAGSSGPGHVHLVKGLYDAHRNNTPLITLASTCKSAESGTSYFQETNTIRLFDDCSGCNVMANIPTQCARMMQQGLQHAIHNKVVSVIGIPGDLAEAKAEEIDSSFYILPTKSVFRPVDEEIQELADLINQHEKITLYCGVGVKEAHAELIQLADKIKSPIGYSFRGKMAVQHNNPYEVGLTGLLGLPSAYASMHEADLLVDFPYADFMPAKGPKIVQIDNRPERIGRRQKQSKDLQEMLKIP